MKLKILLAATGLAAAVLAPAISQTGGKLPDTITWTAYDVGSGGYNQAVAIGNALKNKMNVTLRVLPGKSDIARSIPLRDGQVPFSAHGVGGSYMAQEGLYEFGSRDWGPQAVRALLLNNSDALLTIVTAKDANIKTMADLKGKRVAWVVGAPALNQNITALMASAGLTWNDVKRVEFGGFGAAMDGIVANQVDAAFASTISGQAYKIAASPRGVQYPVVPHNDKAAWERLNKVAPFYVRQWGAEGADLSATNKVEGATYPYPVLMSMANANPELVYNMTKAMVELFPDYKDNAPGNVGWDIKRQMFAWAIPTHEGAVKYFKELKLWTDEHQKHNDALLARQKVLADAWNAYKPKASSDDKEFIQGWMKARAAALTAAKMDVVVESW
jgi:TRAP transporter TAXI family solute receptor